jgi:hypothetical protein
MSTRKLVVWIPGAPRSPNRRDATTRGRMARVKLERERAHVATHRAAVVEHFSPVTGPAHVEMLVLRRRPLDDDNVVASCRNYRNGVARAVLPHGDGPRTPYTWLTPTQVPTVGEEGVLVRITRL